MELIKVYDIKSWVKSQLADKQIFRDDSLAIIEGKFGVLVFDYEGVGWQKNTVNATISLGFNDIMEKNHIALFPTYHADVPIKDIIAEAEYKEMTLLEFCEKHNYNSRCQGNFSNILKMINQIGLKDNDFLPKDFKK